MLHPSPNSPKDQAAVPLKTLINDFARRLASEEPLEVKEYLNLWFHSDWIATYILITENLQKFRNVQQVYLEETADVKPPLNILTTLYSYVGSHPRPGDYKKFRDVLDRDDATR